MKNSKPFGSDHCVVLQAAVIADALDSSRDKLRKANCGVFVLRLPAVHRLTQLELFGVSLSQYDCRSAALLGFRRINVLP